MKCSACSVGTLLPSYVEDLFACHTCSNCGGQLIMMGEYLRWQDERSGFDLQSRPPVDVIAEETSKAMICPKSGRLMTKYRISKDTDHRIDLSPSINAIWLDKGEWELLKQNQLAHRLNNIFTAHWQHEIRDQESAASLVEMHKRKFGDQYDQLVAFKNVLDAMENRSEAIAFLLSDDPYRT